MIGIQLEDGSFLDLDEGTAVEMQLKNPIFADDGVIPSSYTIPFDVPASDANASKLGNPHVIEHASKFKKAIPVKLHFNRAPWMPGQLNIRNVNERKFNVNFLSGIKNLGDDFKTARLRDIISHEIVLADTPRPRIIHLTISDSDWQQPTTRQIIINNQTATLPAWPPPFDTFLRDAAAGLFKDAIDAIEGVSCTFHTSGYDGTGHNYWEIKTDVEDPLAELSINGGEETVWRIKLPFLTPYLDEVCAALDQYISETPPNDILRFPVCFNQGYGGYDQGVKTADFINFRANGSFFRNEIDPGDYDLLHDIEIKNYNSITPFVLFRHVIDKIQESTGVRFAGDFVDSPFVDKLLWWNSYSIDAMQTFINDHPFLFVRRSFNVNEFVPDIDIATFIKEIQKLFCLSVQYKGESNTIFFNFRKDTLAAKTYEDITSKAGRYEDLDNVDYGGYTLRSKQDSSDKRTETDPLKNPFEPVVVGGGLNSVECEISGVTEGNVWIPGQSVFVAPLWSAAMSAQFAPRLMFYEGIITTPTNTYAQARQSLDGYSLEWTSENGFYAKFWKEYARFLYLRAKVSREISFNLADLLNLDWAKKYRIDRVNYLIESISVRMTMKGLKAGKAELWKCG